MFPQMTVAMTWHGCCSFSVDLLYHMSVGMLKAQAPHSWITPWPFSSVQSFSCVWLFATPWTVARHASLSITNSQSLPKLMSIELVMPSNHLTLCRLLLLPPSIFPSIWVFSNDSVLHIRWPKFQSFSFNISPSNEYSGLISFRMDWLALLQPKGLSKVSPQFKSINSSALIFLYSPTFTSIHDYWKNHRLD